MLKTKITLFLIYITVLLPGAFRQLKAQQPNVLVIIVDDLGYGDLSCQGSTEILTPNIDRLAESGIRFTDGYVTAPQCGPSRAGLISGVFQDRFGYNDIINQSGLPPKSVLLTLPEQMKIRGYVTGMAGKWHVGYKNPEYVHPPEINNAPWLRGFDFVNMHDGGMSHYYNYSETGSEWNLWRGIDNRYLRKRESEIEPSFVENLDPETYMTDYLTDEACAFIQRHQSESWFFYLSYNAPHTPMVAKKEKLAKYAHLNGVRGVLAAMMESLDDGVGKVIETIRLSGQAENTMVWFLSDNGGETPQNGSLNDPLAGRKGHLFEGGIRVPFIVAFPGTLPAGKVETEPISSLDILPTSIALAGAQSIPDIYDGHNVLPWLQDRTECPNDELFWSFWGNYAIRLGDYKEVRSKRNDVKTADGRSVPGHFFSNIRNNPGEEPNKPLNNLKKRQMLSTCLDRNLLKVMADQKILEPVFSPEFHQKVNDQKKANQRAKLLNGQWIRIDFEQIDSKSRIVQDIIMPPKTNGYYTKNCHITDGIKGKALRFKSGSMTIGKTPSTTEFKCPSPVTSYLWLRPEVVTKGIANVIDMTDNILPIEDSGSGYRLQINSEQKLQLLLKTEEGQVYKHVYEDFGALPLNHWSFIALRIGTDNKVTLTCLKGDIVNSGVVSIKHASETFKISGKLSFPRSLLPRVASNVKGNGNFFEGSIDEIGLVRGWVSDAELWEAYEKMLDADLQ